MLPVQHFRDELRRSVAGNEQVIRVAANFNSPDGGPARIALLEYMRAGLPLAISLPSSLRALPDFAAAGGFPPPGAALSISRPGTESANMGLGGLLRGALRVATAVIPGEIDDLIVDSLLPPKGGRRPGPYDPFPGTSSMGFTAPNGGGFGSGGPCTFPSIRVGDTCVDPTAVLPGGDPFTTPVTSYGAAVLGLYGEGRAPTMVSRSVRQCPPGYALGKDGVCYDHISNRNREHPKGRKPLLTGGEMNAITRAASAGRRLERAKKSLKRASKALQP